MTQGLFSCLVDAQGGSDWKKAEPEPLLAEQPRRFESPVEPTGQKRKQATG
jgi:hypothetical protein